jgi:serine phosphatase RsbU (regulator of sigma subunit)
LSVAGKVLGALRFSFDERRLFDEDERGFVLALAAQTAQTLQRTELYEAERRAAVNLQRALLPARLPTIAGWDFATHYSPAGDQEAGGDFYDAIVLPDGRFLAVVGDVMGRGIEAAASMAQVRSTVLAYALEDPDPVTVFRRVDAFFTAINLDQLVTMAYLLVDPSAGDVQLASAGHVPPVLVRTRDAQAVASPAELPFGVGRTERHARTLHLEAGEAIVLITDGLVERRGEDIDLGISRVVAAASSSAGAHPAALLDDVLAASVTQDADDDVTVLVLRRY